MLLHTDYSTRHKVLEHAIAAWQLACNGRRLHNPSVFAAGQGIDISTRLVDIAEMLVYDESIDVERPCFGLGRECFRFCSPKIITLLSQKLVRPLGHIPVPQLVYTCYANGGDLCDAPTTFTSITELQESNDAQLRSITQSSENYLHVIAQSMGDRVRILLDKKAAHNPRSVWALLQTDHVLREWNVVLKKWIRLGCNLLGMDRLGYSPLQRCLRGKYISACSGNEALPVQYWACCLFEAGVDLVEYGKTECLRWARPVFVINRESKTSGPNIQIDATQLLYGPDFDQWDVVLRRVLKIPLYRLSLQVIPGSWPSNSVLPETICWHPYYMGDEAEEQWIRDRDVNVACGPRPLPNPAEPWEPVNVLKGSQDDNLAAARLLTSVDYARGSKRRSSSQPPPYRHYQSNGHSRNFGKTWLGVYMYKYATLGKTVSTTGRPYDCQPLTGFRVYWEPPKQYPKWPSEHIIASLRAWRAFFQNHGSSPVKCSTCSGSLVDPLVYEIVDAMDVFNDPWCSSFCSAFPHCVHQTSYLDMLKVASAM